LRRVEDVIADIQVRIALFFIPRLGADIQAANFADYYCARLPSHISEFLAYMFNSASVFMALIATSRRSW